MKLLSNSGIYDSRLYMKEVTGREEARLRKESAVSIATINSNAAVERAELTANTDNAVETLRSTIATEIAQNRYAVVADSEKRLNRRFFDLTDAEREKVMKRGIDEWERSTHGSDARPFSDLFKEKRRTLDIDLRI